MRLSDINTGHEAVVVKILGHGAFRRRVIEMGFIKGQTVKVLLNAPLKDPIKYSIMGYELSLRRSEADMVIVVPVEEAHDGQEAAGQHSPSTLSHDAAPAQETDDTFHGHARTINIALIGNPNCGKTTLFNETCGAKEHVGNYSGVTVDAKEGHFEYRGYRFNIVDLPGTYSLSCYSPEELYVRRFLRQETPDVIVNVVVASNLERNLYLTTELIDMNRSMMIAVNMYDELERSGAQLDYRMLGQMIGVPMVPVVSRTGQGVNTLLDTVISVYEGNDSTVRHIHVNLGPELERSVGVIKDAIKADPTVGAHFSPRYIAIKLMEHDSEAEHLIDNASSRATLLELRDAETQRLIKALGNSDMTPDDIPSLVAHEKYGFISGALAETLTPSRKEQESTTRVIDSLVTNKLFGFPLFLAVMWFMFWCTFEIGAYPMKWIENGVDAIARWVSASMAEGPLKDLIADGIIGGVGGVIVFLPNILILYFFISFLEDSGYMARAAFIMDKIMHRIGLHGKSFIPLVMGFGCNVPAIMASRAIESRSSRIITILINPFMSCSGRLPVYVLLVGIFFPAHASAVMLGLYALGVAVAVVTARLLRRFWFKADETPFVMELPPYRLPTLKSSLRHMWGKGEQYLKKMGGIILVASIIVWALNYFPLHDEMSSVPSATADDTAIDPSRDSYLEMMGKAINPVMEPLGFHWRSTVAVIAGAPAKEIVVSTLGVLYTGNEEIGDAALSSRLTSVSPATGKPYFNPASALSLMVFVLLYFPCTATVTAIVRETGSWRYGLFSVVYNTLVAWLVAFGVYRVALFAMSI